LREQNHEKGSNRFDGCDVGVDCAASVGKGNGPRHLHLSVYLVTQVRIRTAFRGYERNRITISLAAAKILAMVHRVLVVSRLAASMSRCSISARRRSIALLFGKLGVHAFLDDGEPFIEFMRGIGIFLISSSTLCRIWSGQVLFGDRRCDKENQRWIVGLFIANL